VQNLVVDGRKLPLGIAAAYHEIIGEAANLAGVQQNNVNRLLIGGSLNRLARYVYRFQKLNLPLQQFVPDSF
jgi:hypothetical protein